MTETTRTLPGSAFTLVAGNVYRASELTRGPWHPEHQHAGPPIALTCRAVEAAAREHGLTHVSRLTANLLRPVPIGELAVQVQVDYVGRNAGHFSARLSAGDQGSDKEFARFTALVQRENPLPLPEPTAGQEPEVPPVPEDSPTCTFPFAGRHVGYGDLVETRLARGRFFDGPCAAWFRLSHPLLAGETPSDYQRVAVFADSGNGISAAPPGRERPRRWRRNTGLQTPAGAPITGWPAMLPMPVRAPGPRRVPVRPWSAGIASRSRHSSMPRRRPGANRAGNHGTGQR